VRRTISRRQLKFPHHAGKAPDLFDQRLRRSWTSNTSSPAMAELIALPSLAMAPMVFSLMASDLHRASQAWLRAAASCSRDT
jgi:hypothetical protein